MSVAVQYFSFSCSKIQGRKKAMRNECRAVLFDLDGVVTDLTPAVLRAGARRSSVRLSDLVADWR